jgi:hypothetical protein
MYVAENALQKGAIAFATAPDVARRGRISLTADPADGGCYFI